MFYGVLTIILVGLVPCPVMGQVPTKKQLTEADYTLWQTMCNEQLSAAGNWVSYCMSYDQQVDTTFLMHTKTLQKVVFPAVRTGQFIGEQYFSVLKNGTLVVHDLEKGIQEQIPNVSRYDYTTDGLYLVTLENSTTLVLRKNGAVLKRLEHISSYQWNPAKTQLFYSTYTNDIGSVGYLQLNENFEEQIIIVPTTKKFTDITWQPNGKSVAFYADSNGIKTLLHYDLGTTKLHVLNATDFYFPEGMAIGPNQNIKMKIAKDGQKVFFCLSKERVKDSLDLAVEVWHAKDKVLYRNKALMNTVTLNEYLAVWNLKETTVRQLSTEEQKWVALTGNQDYALVADPKQYEPIYKWIGDMDYYLMDLKTGVTELLLVAQSGYTDQMDFSPDGRFILYYKKGNWWIYDLEHKSHVSLTAGLDVSWDNSLIDPGNELKVWGQAGWTQDGKVLLYDYHDIWSISADSKQRKRLTRGREKNVRYRLHASALSTAPSFNYNHISSAMYDVSKEVVLTAVDLEDGSTGFYTLEPTGKLSLLVMEKSLLNKYQKATGNDAFIYVKQRFDVSPTLMLQRGKKTKILVQSNRQQKAYAWGKAELIYYKDSKGHPLKGVLYYPANYDSQKNYPMVVHIYETLSNQLHYYCNPTMHNGIGFNITNLVTDGYFVLQPDIAYERGNSGQSALDCVTAAVQKVIAMGVVDAHKIGLYGQSFGGYETNYIITQTHMFAAAISGSAVSDTTQHYFTINTIYNTIDGWRYENQQYRMGFHFYENQEAYFRNNPLLHASNITTPLLTWAGKKDKNVQPRQAESFYAALRRLKKEHTMLVYEKEGHIFYDTKYQKDLTEKMNSWFGYYLKGAPKPQWML
jgi:dipeptidyl aminopeptidase/acylaminoacyl peptidase